MIRIFGSEPEIPGKPRSHSALERAVSGFSSSAGMQSVPTRAKIRVAEIFFSKMVLKIKFIFNILVILNFNLFYMKFIILDKSLYLNGSSFSTRHG